MTKWGKAKAYLELSRPFTLVAPALGMVSGGVVGWGATAGAESGPLPWAPVAMGAIMAALLNAASNALNQICDWEIDAINKPRRPLPSGHLSMEEARLFSAVLYPCALVLAWLINIQCFALAVVGALFTVAYSLPPLRTKRFGLLANVTIAVPRGTLLFLAGWSTTASVFQPEPWYISMIFGGFLLGAASTKDFADVEGDRLGGCRTLPVMYGARMAAWAISPSLVLPFLLLPLGVRTGILTGHPLILSAMGWVLAGWGALVAYIMITNPRQLTSSEKSAPWTHMYLLMAATQLGLLLAYSL